jgi:hypothetical protein
MSAVVTNFSDRVKDYSVVSFTDTEAVSQSITDGCYDVVRKIQQQSPEAIHQFVAASEDITGNVDINLDKIKNIISVERDGLDCQQSSWRFKKQYTDSGSIYYVDDSRPAYTIHNGSLSIYPAPTSSQIGKYYYLPDYIVQNFNSGESSIENFPSDFYEHVCLYAAIKVLETDLMASDSLLDELKVQSIVLSQFDKALPVYSNIAMPVLPSSLSDLDIDFTGAPTIGDYNAPVFSIPSLPSISAFTAPPAIPSPTTTLNSIVITGTAPSYREPGLVLDTAPAISLLTFGGLTSPTVPDVIASLLEMPSAPTYTAPTILLDTSINISVVPPTPPTLEVNALGAIGTALPTFTSPPLPSLDFADTENWISVEEDEEMLGARISEINAKISAFGSQMNEAKAHYERAVKVYEDAVDRKKTDTGYEEALDERVLKQYQTDVQTYIAQANNDIKAFQIKTSNTLNKYQAEVQNAANEFREDVAIYQATLQANIKKADIDSDNMKMEFQKFTSALNKYQADVQTTIQEWQLVTQNRVNMWQIGNQSKVQEYQANLQNALNDFNKDNVDFQATLQRDSQTAQLKDAQEARILQKYGSDISKYNAEVNSALQNWINTEYNPVFQEWTTEINSGLQKYQADIQNEMNRISHDTSIFREDLNKRLSTYQSETGYDISKYQAEVQSSLNKHQSDLSNSMQSFNSELQNYQSELQSTTANNQAMLNQFSSELQSSQANMGVDSTSYQWRTQHLMVLKQKYNELFGMVRE